MGSLQPPTNICLVGSGGVGTMAAVVLEKAGARVTAVMRSKHDVVSEKGWNIDSVDHGILNGWKSSRRKSNPTRCGQATVRLT